MALKVLVTGAAGALGKEVVSNLRSTGYEVLACGRAASEGIDTVWDVSCDYGPEIDYSPSVVIHTAAKVGTYQQDLSEAGPLFDVNVAGTMRVAKWCVERRVQRLVLISGAVVYGIWDTLLPKKETDPTEPWRAGSYALSTWCSEQAASLASDAGCELAILRLSSLYGAGYRQGLLPRLLTQARDNGCLRMEPPTEDSFDFLHLRDAAEVVRQCLKAEHGGLWNVGSGSVTTIREVAEVCAAQYGGAVEFNRTATRSPRVLNWVDDTKARLELGHRNQVSLEEGIREIAHSLQVPSR